MRILQYRKRLRLNKNTQKGNKIQDKRKREKEMVSDMILLYCRKQHKSLRKTTGLGKTDLCPECADLEAYARMRSDKCPFMETKTFCSNCRVHCYKPDMRDRIRVIMRFSGPRMLFVHPVAAVRHVIESRKEAAKIISTTSTP